MSPPISWGSVPTQEMDWGTGSGAFGNQFWLVGTSSGHFGADLGSLAPLLPYHIPFSGRANTLDDLCSFPRVHAPLPPLPAGREMCSRQAGERGHPLVGL